MALLVTWQLAIVGIKNQHNIIPPAPIRAPHFAVFDTWQGTNYRSDAGQSDKWWAEKVKEDGKSDFMFGWADSDFTCRPGVIILISSVQYCILGAATLVWP